MKTDDLIAQILNDEGEEFLVDLGREIRRRGYLDNPDLRPEHILIEVEEGPVLDDMWSIEVETVDEKISITRFFPLFEHRGHTASLVLTLFQKHYWEISAYVPMRRGSTRIIMKRIGHRGDNRAFDLFAQMGQE